MPVAPAARAAARTRWTKSGRSPVKGTPSQVGMAPLRVRYATMPPDGHEHPQAGGEGLADGRADRGLPRLARVRPRRADGRLRRRRCGRLVRVRLLRLGRDGAREPAQPPPLFAFFASLTVRISERAALTTSPPKYCVLRS